MNTADIKNFYRTYLKPDGVIEWLIVLVLVGASASALALLIYSYSTSGS